MKPISQRWEGDSAKWRLGAKRTTSRKHPRADSDTSWNSARSFLISASCCSAKTDGFVDDARRVCPWGKGLAAAGSPWGVTLAHGLSVTQTTWQCRTSSLPARLPACVDLLRFRTQGLPSPIQGALASVRVMLFRDGVLCRPIAGDPSLPTGPDTMANRKSLLTERETIAWRGNCALECSATGSWAGPTRTPTSA